MSEREPRYLIIADARTAHVICQRMGLPPSAVVTNPDKLRGYAGAHVRVILSHGYDTGRKGLAAALWRLEERGAQVRSMRDPYCALPGWD